MSQSCWKNGSYWVVAILLSATGACSSSEPSNGGPLASTVKSAGRGAPVMWARDFERVGPNMTGNPERPENTGASVLFAGGDVFNGSARNGAVPAGIEPLPIDIFTSKDFYKDRALWSDKRYFRCNSSLDLESQWGASGIAVIGDNGPATGAWGHCDRDMPREALVSPYPFKTAQEHYKVLLDEARTRGGPTQHTYATVPGEWTGRYQFPTKTPGNDQWFWGHKNQIPTFLSLLTSEYQQRAVQEHYHHANSNVAHWPAQYCWPEGFMRRWHWPGTREHVVLVTPWLVQIATYNSDNFVTEIHIGREFNMEGAVPRLGADVPRWYGETIGFWDGDVLVSWTSNIQGWKTHGAFEFSNRLQTIEIYTPNRNPNGGLEGLLHEAVLYDPESFVEPLRIVRNLRRLSGIETGDPKPYVECVQTIFPVKGKATPLTPGATFTYEVPDMFGRPWAQMWERYNERGMEKPVDNTFFDFGR